MWEQVRNPQPEDFYCLQPLVLKRFDGSGYEVVDGQQRLTTLLLILRHLNERASKKYQLPIFGLEYETRPDLKKFLDEPTEAVADSNVDFFYLFEAIKTIEHWFNDKDGEIGDFTSALRTKTKVIWFQLSDSDNAVEAFTRLNVGKIPLTNDELIRALFLRRNDAKEYGKDAAQFQIAYEWDQLEKALQSDPFWYFLTDQVTEGQNRIGFIFDLVARAEGIPAALENDAHAVFYTYSKKFNDEATNPKEEWLKIKQAFMTLEEWFEDRYSYHVVGFLIQQRFAIAELRRLSECSSKTEFAKKLRQAVWSRTFGGDLTTLDSQSLREKLAETLDDLEYGRHSSRIRALLLLFNLATLLQNDRSNIRFQFDSFKKGKWDIEHVRSVSSDRPGRYDARKEWFTHCLGYLEQNLQEDEEDLRNEIKRFVTLSSLEALDSIFDRLYDKVLILFQEASEDAADNNIANLTLLDHKTNRSYKNAVFAVKRKRLLELDQAGTFVPLCTRNVFLKCYSPQVDTVIFWSQEDREAYRAVIIDTLSNFFEDKKEDIL